MHLAGLQKIFKKRDLWSVGVFKLRIKESLFCYEYALPVKSIGETGLRLSRDYQSVVADPFLFVYDNKLHLFYEVKTDHGKGEIHAKSMSSDGHWHSYGPVLVESFHLSYPQVFSIDGKVYMIPESAQSGEVRLYEADEFPGKWKLNTILVNEPLRDPTIIIQKDTIFLLGTTKDYELKFFYASGIQQQFVDTGIIISRDKAVARCAGNVIKYQDMLLRPVQDCSEMYGGSVKFQKIEEVTPYNYREKKTNLSLDILMQTWMKYGGHHVSYAIFNDNLYVAIDGRKKDYLINNLMLVLFRVLEKIENKI